MNPQTHPQFQTSLLRWYGAHARILPWRDYPAPYRVWISEIMLQQTRVDTVKPYFERFLDDLPTVEALAQVDEEQLFKLWEGLGYYNRARNLKRAAQMIVEHYHGQLPDDYNELLKLPGIGAYTAGAIASIAYGRRVSAVDGNVLRVFARLTANHGDIGAKQVKDEITALVNSLLPHERVGDFNQALMELGATVCLPNGAPKCADCPVGGLCAAYESGLTGQLPVKSRKAPRKLENKTVLLIVCKGKIAIKKRPEGGLLPRLWELPNTAEHLTAQQCDETLKGWGIPIVGIQPLPKAKHIFTHMEWHMIGYLIYTKDCPAHDDWVWVTPWALAESYSVPTAFKAYINVILDAVAAEPEQKSEE